MKRNTLVWALAGIVVLAIGAMTVLIGRAIMPPRATAETIGTIVPWFITWGMIWMTAIIAIILAVTIFATGLGSERLYSVPIPPGSEPARTTADAPRRYPD